MIHVLARLKVADRAKFLEVFSSAGAALRAKHGCTGTKVMRASGTEGDIVILFDWPSREAFNAFLADPGVREALKPSTALGPAEFTILEPMADLPN